MIEPGCAACRDLRLERQIGSHREHDGREISPLAFQMANLDNAAHGRCMLDGPYVGKPYIVRAPVDAIDDHIGLPRELVIQAFVHQAADDGGDAVRIVNGIVAERTVDALPGHRAVHGLDDVPADAEIAKRRFGFGRNDPLGRTGGRGQPHALQTLQAADHQATDLGVALAGTAEAQIDDAVVVRLAADGRIEPRPAIRIDLALEDRAHLVLAPGSELDRNQLLGTGADVATDIVAADHEIAAIVGLTAGEQVDVWVIGVPVVHPDPVEPAAEIAFHVGDEVARKRLQVGHVARILGTDHEPEMMPIALASGGEGLLVGTIARGIEHARLLSVPGHALAPQIGDVCGERCSAECAASVPHHAGLDDDPTRRVKKTRRGNGCAVSSAEGRAAQPLAGWWGSASDIAGLVSGLQHLAHE